ncbi:hypothetical protein J4E91_009986 [Alternaria rosae]|nr:hypothetical protein J4E91_009986 [Alternaria rosae]
MLFSKNITLSAIATLLSLAQLGRADNCTDAPRVPGTFIGVGFSDDKKNLYNCDTKWIEGLVVTGMEVWSSQWQVKGIRLTYSDGTQSPIRGRTDNLNQWGSKISGKSGPPPDNGYGWDRIEWGVGEIDKVRLWVNYNNGDGPNAVGRVQIWPNGADNDQKRILDVGSDVGGDGGGILVDNLGSGVLIGMRTQSGDFLDSLEFVFMDGKVESAEIVHIEWPESIDDLNKKHGTITEESAGGGWIQNSNRVGGQLQDWDFGSGISKTQTRTITQQTTEIMGGSVSVSVSASIQFPVIGVSVTVGGEAHWESQSMKSTAVSDTTTYPMTVTQKSSTNGPLYPQHAIHCTVLTSTSNYNTEYTSTVRATMSNGKTFDINQRGKLVSVLYTEGRSKCYTVKINDIPSDADVNEGDNIPGSESPSYSPSSSASSPSSLPVSAAPSPRTPASPAVPKRAIAFQG